MSWLGRSYMKHVSTISRQVMLIADDLYRQAAREAPYQASPRSLPALGSNRSLSNPDYEIHDPDIHSRKYIIHTVGPTYHQFDLGEGKALFRTMLRIVLGPRKKIQAASYCEHPSGWEVLIVPCMMPCPGVPLHISKPKGAACSKVG